MAADFISPWIYTKGEEIIGRAYATSGYRGALQQGVRSMEQDTAGGNFDFPETIAEIYILLGDKDKAFYGLRRPTKNGMVSWTNWRSAQYSILCALTLATKRS